MRAVVFDVGNVLYHWDPAALYTKLIRDAGERAWFLEHVVTPEWHFQHDAGRPFAETSAELGALFPAHQHLINAWGPRFDETVVGPIDGMLELVNVLHDAGIALFAITNFSAEFWAPFRAKRSAVFDRFQDILVSGEERLVKPDPAIFALARSRFKLSANDSLFIDDRRENVSAAEKLGFLGHHFTSYAALAPVLRQFKLPYP